MLYVPLMFMQYVILFEEKFAAFFPLRLCVKNKKENGTRIGSDFADFVCAFDVYAVCDTV